MDSGPCSWAMSSQPFRDYVQGLVPADAFEGVSLAAVGCSPFGRSSSAAHRVEQPRGRIDTIQILGDLAAEKAAGHGMIRITLHPCGHSRFIDRHQNGAGVRTVVRTNGVGSSRSRHKQL